MVMEAVVERCARQGPVTVMARLALQRALEPAWVDAMFERECGAQYTRELLFSTVVELMSMVVAGLQPSVHAAAQACEDLPVSIQALYDKIRHTEPKTEPGASAGGWQCRTPESNSGSNDPEQGADRATIAVAHCRWQPFAGQREAAQAVARLPWCGAARAILGRRCLIGTISNVSLTYE